MLKKRCLRAFYNKIMILSLFFGLFSITGHTQARAEIVRGVIVVGERGCSKSDVIVIQTSMGFVIAEVFSGFFDKGDLVVGELNSFGMHDVLVNGMSGSLYIDDYFLSRSEAARKCFRS